MFRGLRKRDEADTTKEIKEEKNEECILTTKYGSAEACLKDIYEKREKPVYITDRLVRNSFPVKLKTQSKEEYKAIKDNIRVAKEKVAVIARKEKEKRWYDKADSKSDGGKYKRYKEGAERKGRDFTISFEHFALLVNSDCFYCGGEGFGVDRIDSNIGYVDGNVRPCCAMCNMMKYTYSTDKYLNQIKKIHDNLKL